MLNLANTRITATRAKMTADRLRRLPLVLWSMCRVSATVRRRPRKAVSPEVMGRTTMPTRAMTPPTGPRMSLQTLITVLVAPALAAWRPALKMPMAAPAQTMAMKPSRTIML